MKKAKIAITGDPHFHSFEEFARIIRCPVTDFLINSRLSDQIVTFWKLANSAKRHGCAYLVVNGDLFHVRGVVPTEVQQAVYRLFERIREELGLLVTISTGNHDQVDLKGTIHGIYSFKNLVDVVDTPLQVDLGGTDCIFIPYMASHEDTLHCFARADVNGPVDIVFAHCGVDGAYIGPIEYKIKDPLTVEDIHPERFKWVILSHYHKPQMMADNVLYVGSPAQINRGEIGETKRWLLYDPQDQRLQSYKTGAKEFKKITTTQMFNSNCLSDHYYDVVEDEETSIKEARNALDVGDHIKFIAKAKVKNQEARIKVTQAMTDTEILSKYIEYVNGDKKLLKLGLKLLAESVSMAFLNVKLLQVRINNFMGISGADVVLDRPGSVIAVLGENRSAEGFTSNGAGKSTMLPESILWCLWGDTIRGLPADKVVNRTNKRDCWVSLAFENSHGQNVVVTRYRKSKIYGANALIVSIDGDDQSYGTPELTQKYVDGLIGVDWETFNAVIAFSPDTLRFVKAKDSERKHVMDAILQTQRYASAKQSADNGVNNLERVLSKLYTEIQHAKNKYEGDMETLARYRVSNTEYMSHEAERVKRLESDKSLAEAACAADEEMLDTQEHRLENAKKKLQVETPDTEATQAKVLETSEAESAGTSELRLMLVNQETIQAKLDAAVDQAGKPCPLCGQEVSNTGKLINAYRRDLMKSIQQLEQTTRDVRLLTEAKNAAKEAHRNAQESQREYLKDKDAVAMIQRTVNTTKANVANAKRDIARLEERIKDVPPNPFPKYIEDLTDTMEKDLGGTTEKETQYEKQHNLQEKLRFWQRGFGAVGIPLFLLEQMMPTLTEYANDIAYQLTGGAITIEFSTFQESTIHDRFQIKAINEDGSDVYAGNSSGEKRRIDLCVMLALFKLAYDRTRVNVLLLDEALDTLDTAGLDNIVLLLNSFAKELNLTIYVTSHTDLNQRLHESITVVKEEGLATCYST